MDERAPGLSDDDKTYAMLCHLAAFSTFLGVPFGNLIGPLIVWLIKKKESRWVDHHGKEVLNFQISMLLWSFLLVIFALTGAVAGPMVFLTAGIAIVAGLILALYGFVATILGAIRANDGRNHYYLFSVRFLS